MSEQKMITLLVDKFVTPIMSAYGFRKAQLVWNREKDGIVHMFNIQLSQWNDKDNIHFTINLGVCIKRVWQIYWNKMPPRIIRESDCFPCLRVGYLLSEGTHQKDVWWLLKSSEDIASVGNELQDVIQNKCIPFLDKLDSAKAVLTVIEDPVFRKYPAETLFYAILKHLTGASIEASQLLNTLLANDKPKTWHTRVQKVSERLASLSSKLQATSAKSENMERKA